MDVVLYSECCTDLLLYLQPDVMDFDSPILPLLLQLRETCSVFSPSLLLWSLFFTGLFMFVTLALLCPDRSHSPRMTAPKVDISGYLEAM